VGLLQQLAGRGPVREVLTEIADTLARALGCERIFLFQMRKRGGFHVIVARTHDREDISRPSERVSHQAVRKMVSTDDTLFVADARQDRRYRPEEALQSKKMATSILVIPLRWGGEIQGGIYVDHRFHALTRPSEDDEALEGFVLLAALALQLRAWSRVGKRATRDRGALAASAAGAIDAAGEEPPTSVVEELLLRGGAGKPERFQGLISANPDLRDTFDLIRSLSRSDLPVLVQGETGTGKGLLARAVHDVSTRREKPFVVLHCGAMPRDLIESELLGHVKGAFTGAEADHDGLLLFADGGTLFLDDVADMSFEVQKKLLRVLEDGLVRPVGGKFPRQVDVRIICSASRSVHKLTRQGRFRRDLYFRLKGVVLDIPSLCDRREDILLLAAHFLEHYARRDGRDPAELRNSARLKLLHYNWPGNVRELENEMRRVVALGRETIGGEHLSISLRSRRTGPESSGSSPREPEATLQVAVEAAEREAVLNALQASRWNKSRASVQLGITRKSLYRRMAKYGISEDSGDAGG
jgi:transcriptional regulator with GAF, ATPase, and Fis domain